MGYGRAADDNVFNNLEPYSHNHMETVETKTQTDPLWEVVTD